MWRLTHITGKRRSGKLFTNMSTAAGIPVVDFSSLSLNQTDDELDETKMKETISEMMNAFSTTGFVYLSNTHFPEHLVRLSTQLLAFS